MEKQKERSREALREQQAAALHLDTEPLSLQPKSQKKTTAPENPTHKSWTSIPTSPQAKSIEKKSKKRTCQSAVEGEGWRQDF